MNKVLVIFILLINCLACNRPSGGEDMEKLESEAAAQANAKVNSVINQLKADCDSTIYRMATQKADSIKQERKLARAGKRHRHKK